MRTPVKRQKISFQNRNIFIDLNDDNEYNDTRTRAVGAPDFTIDEDGILTINPQATYRSVLPQDNEPYILAASREYSSTWNSLNASMEGLRSVLGPINPLTKSIPNLESLTEPLATETVPYDEDMYIEILSGNIKAYPVEGSPGTYHLYTSDLEDVEFTFRLRFYGDTSLPNPYVYSEVLSGVLKNEVDTTWMLGTWNYSSYSGDETKQITFYANGTVTYTYDWIEKRWVDGHYEDIPHHYSSSGTYVPVGNREDYFSSPGRLEPFEEGEMNISVLFDGPDNFKVYNQYYYEDGFLIARSTSGYGEIYTRAN
jgi:hypothetical protein